MKDRGFTLIEILLGMVILAIIGTLTAGSLQATFRTERIINERTELQEIGTAILNKIRDDLSQTIHVETQKPLTTFHGEDTLNHDRIVFTALGHSPLKPEAFESDQTQITYETESNPTDSQLYLLRRRETNFIDGNEKADADAITIASNVVAFDLEYGDGSSFRPTWNIRSTDQLNKLPKLVKVALKLRDQKGREEDFETIVDLPMSEGLGIQASPTPVPAGPQGGQPGAQPGGEPGQTPQPGPARPGGSGPGPGGIPFGSVPNV
jgi:prepilin-type N-terminal cleavage/methylation domain-containing protein